LIRKKLSFQPLFVDSSNLNEITTKEKKKTFMSRLKKKKETS